MYLKRLLFIFFFFQQFLLFSQKGNLQRENAPDIHYQIFGKGEPLLIINGGPGMSSEGSIPLATALGKDYQTIIYDQRGTGSSKMEQIDRSSMTMDLLVEDLEALRKHLKLEEWTILGHSFGGILTYYYAAKHPEKVKAMIHSSSGGMDLSSTSSGSNALEHLFERDRDSLMHYSIKIKLGDNSPETILRKNEFLASAYVNRREHFPIIAKRLSQTDTKINSLIWQDLRSLNYDVRPILKDFGKPVLIIHGAKDFLPLRIAETAHEILPSSKLVVLESAKHVGWLDQEKDYFKAINQFMAQLQ